MRWVLILLILSSCASSVHKDCGPLIAAEEERYKVCQRHVDECLEARRKDSPPLLTKLVYAILGLGTGLVIGVRAR